MDKMERLSIEEPLRNVLGRLEPAVLESISTYTDPAALAIGLLAWITRLAEIRRKQRQVEAAAEAAARKEQPKPGSQIGPQPPQEPEEPVITPLILDKPVDVLSTRPPTPAEMARSTVMP